MGREWMIPNKERRTKYVVRLIFETKDGEHYTEIEDTVCCPEDLDELIENLADFKPDGVFIGYSILDYEEVRHG